MQANKHVLNKIYRKKQQGKPSKTEDFQFVVSESKFFSEKKKDFGRAQMKVER